MKIRLAIFAFLSVIAVCTQADAADEVFGYVINFKPGNIIEAHKNGKIVPIEMRDKKGIFSEWQFSEANYVSFIVNEKLKKILYKSDDGCSFSLSSASPENSYVIFDETCGVEGNKFELHDTAGNLLFQDIYYDESLPPEWLDANHFSYIRFKKQTDMLAWKKLPEIEAKCHQAGAAVLTEWVSYDVIHNTSKKLNKPEQWFCAN